MDDMNEMLLTDEHNIAVNAYEEIAVDDMNDMTELVQAEEHMYVDQEEQEYGGMTLTMYNDILQFKRTNQVPESCGKESGGRSAPSHWRARCKCFSLADDGETLLYFNTESGHNAVPKVVVKKGEVRKVLSRIHELIGHLGQKRTQMVVLRKLYWRSVRQDVKTFISSCDFCTEKKLQGRKITKAPVDITSDNFDISVLVRSIPSPNRLEFELIGYNEAEVKEAAFTRMTSYTFKETANEFRSRYTNPMSNMIRHSNMRRQPYVKKLNDIPKSFLIPFQYRGRQLDPDFVEYFGAGPGRQEFEEHEEVIYDQVVPEIDDGLMREREASETDKRKNEEPAQPVTLLGNLLNSKNFKVEEPEEEEEKTMSSFQQERAGPSTSQKRMDQRYVSGGREVNKRHLEMDSIEFHHNNPPHRDRERLYQHHHHPSSPQPTTTASLIKKRRRELPNIRGMSNRFCLAIGEVDRMDNSEMNRSNPNHIEYQEQSILRGDNLGLPPVIMQPSTNDEVCKLQVEALRRHISIQKLQERNLQQHYARAIRNPLAQYMDEEQLQEEQMEEELIVDDHVFEEEDDVDIHQHHH